MATKAKQKTWVYELKKSFTFGGVEFPVGTVFTEQSHLSDENSITFSDPEGFIFTVPRNGKVHTKIHRSSLVIN